GEIGGNKILIEDEGSKILLDFGLSFSERDRFYSAPWLSPRSERDLLEFGILPKIEGAYVFDRSDPAIDGAFLSHPHLDHSRHICFLKEDIKIYCGEATAEIIKSISDITRSGFETDVSHLHFHAFRSGERISLGPFDVVQVHVDHSIPGSYGYIVHTSGGAIVYTGDFRTHGPQPQLTDDFVKEAEASRPIVAISEGTNFGEATVSGELDVKREICEIVSRTGKIVLASFSYGDIDRLKTFYEVAELSGRVLAISLKQAYLLRRLSQDPHLKIPKLSDPSIAIFQRAKKQYYEWERDFLNYPNIVTASDLRNIQEKVIMVCSFLDFRELIEIRPEPGSVFILSQSEPFTEEMELDYSRL
ncbi:MAG: MBL fold metallo-hydrolase, partial [Candidatus Bathyarchaeia archaeon]